MITLIKHFIISYSTAKELSRKRGFLNFLNVFCIRFFYAFHFVRQKFNKQTKVLSTKDVENIFTEKNFTSNFIVKDLCEKGFNDKLILKSDLLNEIYNEISTQNVTISYKGLKDKDLFHKSLNNKDNLEAIVDKSFKYNLSHVSLSIDMNKAKNIKKVATSKYFLDVANSYLGTNNISVSSLCYVSNPVKITEEEKKDNAQYYHYDNDFKKFFKVFIYLNDVDINAGPHSYIQYSHKKKLFKHIISKRINDDEIEDTYGSKNIITFDRSKGSVIFEDTFGLHKGNYPKTNNRIVLILIYGIGEGIGIYDNSIKNPNAFNL